MADPFVRQARGNFNALIGSTDLVAGDLVYWDGSNWERADADVHTTFAEAIVTNNYKTGDTGTLCTSCILVDTDAPFTQGDNYFLAAPAGTPVAGNFTATRPTTKGNLRQQIGFGLSTTELRMEVTAPYEQHMWVNTMSSLIAAEITVVLDSGNFAGPYVNADSEALYLTFSVPQNCVGIEYARSFSAVEVRTASAEWTTTISGAADAEQWDATTQDATLTALRASGSAEDEIAGVDMVTGFDATGIIEPDNLIGVKLVKAGGNTDITISFGVALVFLVV